MHDDMFVEEAGVCSMISCLFHPPAYRHRVHLFSRNFPIRCCKGTRKVVLTRTHEKNRKLVNALAAHCISSIEFPLVEHKVGPDLGRLPVVLKDTSFDWIIITSPEAGLVFLQAWKASGFPKVCIGVIGAGTASVFREATHCKPQQLQVAFSPTKASNSVLALDLPKCGNQRPKVLYPASMQADNEIEQILSDRGFSVTRLNTYDTVPVACVDQLLLDEALTAPVVAFASSSAVRAWHNLVPKSADWNMAIACIGERTALSARRLGLKNVYYPATPGFEGSRRFHDLDAKMSLRSLLDAVFMCQGSCVHKFVGFNCPLLHFISWTFYIFHLSLTTIEVYEYEHGPGTLDRRISFIQPFRAFRG